MHVLYRKAAAFSAIVAVNLALPTSRAVSYNLGMPPRVNMADPDYDPTDKDLIALSHEAFAGVAAESEIRLAKLRAEVAALSSPELTLAELRTKLLSTSR